MKKTKNILLIFDCDGVLVDSEPIANKIMIECLRREGFVVSQDYAEKHFTGVSTKDCIVHMESSFKRKVSQGFLEKYNQLIKEEIKKTLQPIAGIKKSLDRLPYIKCVASGSEPEKILLSLETTGIKKYFPRVFSSAQVPRGKPFPDIFLYAAQQMSFKPDHCIVIEDSDPGVQASLAAGMNVLLYRPFPTDKYTVPSGVAVFNNMEYLPELIEQTLASTM